MNTGLRRYFASALTLALLALSAAPAGAQALRLRGSLATDAYGYQDPDNTHHVWVSPTANLSMYRTGTPWSLHATVGYFGDTENDYLENGHSRFTRGYLRYDGLADRVQGQLGRFFLVRGPAVGVLDGLDLQFSCPDRNIEVAAFAGLWGPLTRKFEFEEPDQSMAYGGEIAWSGRDILFARRTRLALSYANFERDGGLLRHRVGLATYSRFTPATVWMNQLQLRVEGQPVQRFISRLRYADGTWNTMAEFGLLTPEISDGDWFADFEEVSYKRGRIAVDRWVMEDTFGLGVESSMLLTDQAGYRVGPYVRFPFGTAGYRFYFGDGPKADGLWAQLSFEPMRNVVEVYAYGSMSTYEWEAFDYETSDILALSAGTNVTLPWVPSLRLTGEYQHYQTPQFDEDRRALGRIRWMFDTAEGSR